METECAGCPRDLPTDAEAYVCSYECTFCAECTSRKQNICPHCGGELVRRPRRHNSAGSEEAGDEDEEAQVRDRPGLIWAVAFAVWTFISLAATATIYQLYRRFNGGIGLGGIAGMEFSQVLTYAPLTPLVFALAVRYPLQRGNWVKRSLLHLAAGLFFTLVHISLRAATPYGYWDPASRQWTSAIWDSHAHAFRAPWVVLRSMFLGSVVDDVTGAYVPIVLVAHAVSYYLRFRERELRATQLEGQLAKAHLQALKSQLQPHFLFNTMHSISALMHTDVAAADKMMTLLSELLRMTLEKTGVQVTTLNCELEVLDGYLAIEKVRFGDRLKVVKDFSPDTLGAQVPHLILQPLVENAVRHGVAKRSTGGEICIATWHDDRYLYLRVKDDGPGLDDHPPKKGLGLQSTRERLQTLYGDNQSISITNIP